MKTSFRNIEKTEQFIQGRMNEEDAHVFHAQLLTNAELRHDLWCQQKVYELLLRYHRKRLKTRVEKVHQRVFSSPAFREFQENIYKIFSE